MGYMQITYLHWQRHPLLSIALKTVIPRHHSLPEQPHPKCLSMLYCDNNASVYPRTF